MFVFIDIYKRDYISYIYSLGTFICSMFMCEIPNLVNLPIASMVYCLLSDYQSIVHLLLSVFMDSPRGKIQNGRNGGIKM